MRIKRIERNGNMTGLLEMREKLKLLYSKNDVFIIPVVKFLVAFITISMINGRMGYMTRVDNLAVVMIGSLLCSFMPMGCIILLGALFSLLHMYALSLEVAIVGLVVYLLLFLLFSSHLLPLLFHSLRLYHIYESIDRYPHL